MRGFWRTRAGINAAISGRPRNRCGMLLPPMRKRRWDARPIVRWWRYGLRLGVAMLVLWTMLGTVGFALIERWSIGDAFYMTVITISTGSM